MNDSISELINYGGVCRTAPATPGLLKSSINVQSVLLANFLNNIKAIPQDLLSLLKDGNLSSLNRCRCLDGLQSEA